MDLERIHHLKNINIDYLAQVAYNHEIAPTLTLHERTSQLAKNTKITTNTTLLKLRGTPFKNASDLKASEEQILREEWQSIERARIRRELLMKEENKKILAPFLSGFKAKFTGTSSPHENLVRVYLADDDSIHVDIDDALKSKDINGTMESLVRSLVEGLMGGYLLALGLKQSGLTNEKNSKSKLTRKN